jgi:galactokinase
MTGALLAAALVERGLDPAERGAKEALFSTVVDAHATLGRGGPEHAWWIPGRLEVFGKHTDYAGGRTLVAPVPRGFALVASPREDGRVRVHDARRGDNVTVDPTAAPQAFTGWRRYVDVVVHRLTRNFPGCAFDADIVLASDLPPASGMSSSSALVVAIAASLGAIGDIGAHPAWQTNIRTPLDAAAYYACVENGARFGGLEGDAGVGTHGGSEDHTAIVEGRPGQVSAFAFVPPRAIDVAPVPRRWRFVLARSRAAARKTGAAQEPYNRLAAGTAVLLELWNAHTQLPPAVSLGSVVGSSAAREHLEALVSRSSVPGWPADTLQRRLDHFIREDDRVLPALAAFRDGDVETLRRLSAESQRDAETLLGNQIPDTIALARTALERGAFAACSFGAGFGGSVWALVEQDHAPGFARTWQSDAFVAYPALPLTRLAEVKAGEP